METKIRFSFGRFFRVGQHDDTFLYKQYMKALSNLGKITRKSFGYTFCI